MSVFLHAQGIKTRGWVKKKCTNGFKSGGNILGQSASKRYNKLFIIRFTHSKGSLMINNLF